MRLFVAILLTKQIRQALTDYQADLGFAGVQGNYTSPENQHLTLAFIGEYNAFEDVLEAMADTAFSPFSIRLEGVGFFDDIFWAGIVKNPQLEAYVGRLRKALANAGIPFDRKRFRPHITLIRKVSVFPDISALSIQPPAGRMPVRRVSLMQSVQGKHGMIYHEIGSID